MRTTNVVGRVVQGMELLSVIPRGRGSLGFYQEADEHHLPIRAMQLAADVPEAQRARIEVLRTDTQTFQRLIEARRRRSEPWFQNHAGRVDVCNVPLPVREASR